jgi:hypothetical protein
LDALQNIVYNLLSTEKWEAVHHLLLHVTVEDDDVTKFSLRFASKRVLDEVMKTLKTAQQEAARSLCAQFAESGLRAGFGQLFQELCNYVFQTGGSFRVRSLGSDAASGWVQLPASAMRTVADVPDVGATLVGQYVLPTKSNAAAIDAVLRLRDGDLLLQMTVASDHEVVARGLHVAVEALQGSAAPGRPAALAFVVPPAAAPGWHKRQALRPAGSMAADELERVQWVPQWLLEVPLDGVKQPDDAGMRMRGTTGLTLAAAVGTMPAIEPAALFARPTSPAPVVADKSEVRVA